MRVCRPLVPLRSERHCTRTVRQYYWLSYCRSDSSRPPERAEGGKGASHAAPRPIAALPTHRYCLPPAPQPVRCREMEAIAQ